MPATMNYPLTHQGVRDLDAPLGAMKSGGKDVNVGAEERAVSTLSGAILGGFALGIKGLSGLLLGTAGAASFIAACRVIVPPIARSG